MPRLGLLRVTDWESVVLSLISSHQQKQQQASETPLMIATRREQREAMRWLLEQGASVTIQDQQGQRKGRTRKTTSATHVESLTFEFCKLEEKTPKNKHLKRFSMYIVHG